MIRKIEFEGKSAYAAFMTLAHEPIDEADAELVKIITENGDIYWLTPSHKETSE